METPIPPEELHEALAGYHYDLYKEVHGIRPRWYCYSEMSVEELEGAVLRLQEEVEGLREEVEYLAREDAQQAELEAREAVRAHEERWMNAAAAMGAAGW